MVTVAAGTHLLTVLAMNPRTTPLPPVELADPIWTLEHIAHALRLGTRATRTVIAAPSFPPAFRLTAAPTARLYWMREQVLAHFAAQTAAPSTAPVTQMAATAVGRPGVDPDAAARAEVAALRLASERAR